MGKSKKAGKSSTPSPSSLPITASIPAIEINEPETIEEEEESDLLRLCDAITAKAHVLAPGNSDLSLLQQAKEVVKSSFDRGKSNSYISLS